MTRATGHDAGSEVTPSPAPQPLVLHYEKPEEFRPSTLGPPGPIARAFWRLCFGAGRLVASTRRVARAGK